MQQPGSLPVPTRFVEMLRRKGLRATRCREAILRAAERSGRALSAAELIGVLGHDDTAPDPVTVYRNLDALSKAHLLTRIQSADRSSLYGFCQAEDDSGHGHHHHIVCDRCGRIAEVETCVIEEAALRLGRSLEKSTGFKLTGHTLQLAGLCPRCQHE